MLLLFKDYTNLVLKAYEEKRNANQLSQLLMHATTANIKQHCLNVYNDRINRGEKEEENILMAFFKVPPPGKNFGYVIERCSPDRFRPLQSFIKGEIKNPSLITVELLAWLIDFNPRPLAYAQKKMGFNTDANNAESLITDNNEEQSELNHFETDLVEIPLAEEIKDTENLPQEWIGKTPVKDEKHPGAAPKRNVQNRKLKIAVTTSLVLATLLGGVYLTKTYYTSTNTGCMYWAGDHYEQVPCNENPKGRLIIAMDEEKMKSFKKITRADTITAWSIGKIYYLKNNRALEYFTASGNHPVFVTRTLKVLSPYMFDKYVQKNVSGVDSSAESQTKSLTNR
eukprot:TRINITY_DN7270_c0_g1_i1.p1 TRINITY_DN7270_c0_g1~~TRINITY_DN7270_c0_g1_i1.p1  ORF type:complete len:340 (+),score=-18.00 TRINITY_DN7270_c0_g1_i1:75-1094(+)